MALKKITDADMQGKGTTYLADRPNLGSTAILKRKFEEIVRDSVIPIINKNVDEQEPINVQVPGAYENAKIAQKVSGEAYKKSVEALKAVSGGSVLVVNPVTGLTVSIQVALNEVYETVLMNAIKCGEYDAKAISCGEYDAKEISCGEYQMNGKIIFK